MRRFRWLLNWSLENVHTNDGDTIPVRVLGRSVGTCAISIEGNQIIGSFDLNEDLNNDDYLLYLITTPDNAGQMWLDGILIVPPDDRLRPRARTIREMNEQRAAN